MSKKGRSNSKNKKQDAQSNPNIDKSRQNIDGENNIGGNQERPRKKYRIRKLIFKNKHNVSYGLHTRIYKVHTYVFKGKKYFFEF